MSLVFATSNKNKFEEARKIAEGHDLELEHRDVPYVEIQADDVVDVVKPSAQQATELLDSPCFVEDAGLFIEVLNGFPGPYSAYVYKTLQNRGILRLMEGKENRRAEFVSAVGYCEPGYEPRIFKGKVRGTITKESRGSGGFGFDPIFMPDLGEGGTFAEMSTEMKDALSHRGESIEKLVKWYVRNNRADGDRNESDS
ncbi:hypothetical protein AKJ65_07440 [candidate division MSBL1 archaeon SCGC-AAA259E19]|uniref:dITP/XTP pyrophosphatase n=1 Tax=candidate division MSBL1 archaeon SCGC-AAA259E19 TaxID=1698264 RepID=A0A133UEE8_9EURY|nr:hypothetical protein AKJ65_07440 [candidate division MSBL1 archaeon SCGC-AAA259E19]